MTLEERIKEIKRRYLAMGGCNYEDEDLIKYPVSEIITSSPLLERLISPNEYNIAKLFDDLNLKYEELQNKNKELEAKLNNYEIVSTRRGKSVFVSSAINAKELTRLEVIDESGRVYVNNNCKMELSYQDEGGTLKIFVNNEGVK